MKTKQCKALMCALVSLTALACTSDDDGSSKRSSPQDTKLVNAALRSLRSCGEVDEAVRASARRAMNELLDKQLASALEQLKNEQCWWRGSGEWAEDEDSGASGAPIANSGGDSAAGPSDVSETNNQVSGVDEPDIVKNDDHYIYTIAQGAVHVIEAWPAAQAKLLARITFAATPKKLLLQGDRLLVIGSVPRSGSEEQSYQAWARYNADECSYGYDCDFTGDGQGTEISVLDVSDPAAPKTLRTIATRATFLSARRIGTAVHAMLYEEPALLKTLSLQPEEFTDEGLCTDEETRAYQFGGGSYTQPVPARGDAKRAERLFEALRKKNLAAIDAAPIDQLRSEIEDKSSGDEHEGRAACTGFYDSPRADGTAFLSLMSFDIRRDDSVQTSTIISRAGASYAAADGYYISVRQQASRYGWYSQLSDVEEASTIHKFDLAGNSNRYAASGVVKGRVLNQFSLDAYDGSLRVATTTGQLPSDSVHSTVSVLQQDGDTLSVVGQVDQIGKTEDIRSVRFVGTRGYLVTFKKTDPLFVLDLSQPEAPKLLGELHIPGFSTYMHPLDDDHLLTIGYDADDQGEFAWFRGLMLQIFDVKNPSEPLLAHKLVIGTRGSSSEAATNHLAFNYFAARETLAVPITVCEGGTGSAFGTMTFSGVQLYRANASDGFNLQGQVSHPYVDPYQRETNGQCSNWWTQASSNVKRSVFMDDFVYSISDVSMKVNDLRDLPRDLGELKFPTM